MSPSRIFRWCAGTFLITIIAVVGFKIRISPVISLTLVGASMMLLGVMRHASLCLRIYALIWLCVSVGLFIGSAALDRHAVRNYEEYAPQTLQRMRERIVTTINHALPRTDAGLLSGILIGARSSMPQSLKAAFSTAGITHIVAVSGYNITIIASALFTVFLAFGLRREESAAWVLFGVALFVLLCGASAATLRAGIMGSVAIAARLIGRRTHATTLLLATAAVMALADPHILFDIGFQLSFAALAGLLYITPLVQSNAPRKGFLPILRDVMVQTLCAQSAAIPLVLWYFDSISLVAPLANLLVVPVIPLVMSVGALATALGALGDVIGASAGALSYLWALPWLLLEYIIRTVSFFASLPFASLSLSSPYLKTLVISLWYVILVGIVLIMRYRKKSACAASTRHS